MTAVIDDRVMMNIFTKLGPITVVLLMAACAPVEQEPIITAPTELEISETTATAKAPVEDVIEAPVETPIKQSAKAPVKDPVIEVVEEASDAPVEDPVAEVVEEAIDAPVEEIAEIVEEPVAPPPPPPLPGPFDPVVLIGASPASLQATLGQHDHSFDNSGMSIHHYRQDACLMLVFINQANEITHIDLRHGIVNQQVDIAACHQELGARKESVK